MKIFPFSSTPENYPDQHNQTQLSDITDEQFNAEWQNHTYQWYHRVYQAICFLLFLGPIRLVIGVGGFALMNLFVIYGRMIQLKLTNNNRKFMKKFFYYCLQVSVRLVSFAFGHMKIRIHGKADPDTRIIISNHSAYHDPFIVSYCIHCSVVCKWEIGQSILKYMLDPLDPIYVRRDQSGGQSKLIVEQADNKELLPVLIFPEGTTHKGDYLFKFHRSAFITQHKVQPVLIRYNQPFVPRGWNSYGWTQTNTLEYFFMCLAMPLNFVDVTFLPAMTLAENENSPDKFAENAELLVANFFGIKATTRSNDEIFKHKKAQKAAQQQNTQNNQEQPKPEENHEKVN
ncbi:Acyltransferase family protein [Trichomonas vaginalis G3]|uniref:Acyltransferase family protein n=1 Tax=Trichomonas vaginalis (strain ATCC PRA-98 / G3) TaxID=412133 RepID=A2FH00_TRIV3|nr:sn-1-glycerol-3-phosphate C16:0-DCA-CoA acyl transferase protein [Trichomonas vaginalis G3]EAX95813.1 Acyltransferase family protein [Trichomonas vaginalis G3]KAI5500548.1 sn-1-glycerol-3-phosphate C16:0-DCA-CoA acyl transferase protein [Trichomonas vaginalis G3]|eukprot:XP_001308743.1 Acyltransferase family protein [Trichomonas vaginalis G3]